MADYELAHWINERRLQSYTDKQIKDYLLKYGYTSEIVESALGFIDSHNKKELKMGNPPFAGGTKIGTEHYDTMAVIALISLFFFPLIALPLGILSLKHIKHNPHLQGKAFAVIGIIVSSLILLGILAYIAFVVFIVSIASPV
ncbi:MAG: hypothetical protein U9O94_08660 [Nanoarchaeota archaeon]|nr:hypothetical protein [Nanoarchaeota archaeon]